MFAERPIEFELGPLSPEISERRYGIRSNRIAPTLTRLGALIAALLAVAPTNGPVAFDVMIRGPDGTEVWRRLGRGAIAAALMVLRLEPGEAHEFSLRWAEVDDAGSQVRPGRYTVRGMVPIDGRNRMTAERPLLIES